MGGLLVAWKDRPLGNSDGAPAQINKASTGSAAETNRKQPKLGSVIKVASIRTLVNQALWNPLKHCGISQAASNHVCLANGLLTDNSTNVKVTRDVN